MCFIKNGDKIELVQEMLDCLEHAWSNAYQLMKIKFADVFQAFEMNENAKRNKSKEFEAYCRKLIVIKFNSTSYDLNLFLADFNLATAGQD